MMKTFPLIRRKLFAIREVFTIMAAAAAAMRLGPLLQY
jgi:hypothetical protein